jgi:signal transduction histidine kinase
VGIPGASPETVELTAVHRPGATPEVGATFPIDSQGAIHQAISQKREARLDPVQAQGNEVVTLALLLDTPSLRPLLIEPLVYNRETLGVLIVSEADRKTAEPNDNGLGHAARAAAAQLGWALGMARRAETLARRAEELAVSLRHQETRTWQDRQALEAQAAQSQAELLAARAELEEARAQATQYQRRAEEIAALVDQMQMESGQHGQVVAARQVTALATPNGNQEESGNRSEVIASLSQELRTPMTSINGYTDLLLSESAGILGEMQRRFLHRVKANIERMSGMLDDLVLATAVDTTHLELEPGSVNLAEVIEEVSLGSAAQFRERSITLQLDLAESLPALHADRDSLCQILSHLFANACQCSQSGTQVRVSARQSEVEGFVAVSVTDTGGGISPSDRPRVFSRRYRADHPLIEGLGDTSIGLSIAKTLVEAHGGRIWLDSEMGQGSTFTFILKAVPPA